MKDYTQCLLWDDAQASNKKKKKVLIIVIDSPRPSMAFLRAVTSSSTLKPAFSFTVPLVLDCKHDNQSKSKPTQQKTRKIWETAPTYCQGQRGGGVQEQVQVILQKKKLKLSPVISYMWSKYIFLKKKLTQTDIFTAVGEVLYWKEEKKHERSATLLQYSTYILVCMRNYEQIVENPTSILISLRNTLKKTTSTAKKTRKRFIETKRGAHADKTDGWARQNTGKLRLFLPLRKDGMSGKRGFTVETSCHTFQWSLGKQRPFYWIRGRLSHQSSSSHEERLWAARNTFSLLKI